MTLKKKGGSWMLEIDRKRAGNLPILPSVLDGKADILVNELVIWMRERELSVLQASSLLTLTKTVIEEAWSAEQSKIKV